MAIMAPSALVSMQFHWNKLGGSSLWFIAHVCKHIGVQAHRCAITHICTRKNNSLGHFRQ